MQSQGTIIQRGLRIAIFISLVVSWGNGCTRPQYRRRADSEAYQLIASRELDGRWDVPGRSVEPSRLSRQYLASEEDCGPKPMDDPAARHYMQYPGDQPRAKYYDAIPTRVNAENPVWLDHLPRDEQNRVKLTQPLAVELGLLHSRDYQSQFESVYLNALTLSSNRFEFDAQWFGGNRTGFTATGADLGDQRRLDTTLGRLGFTRDFAGGGQLATSFLNGLVWDFGASGLRSGSASLVTTFTQPLLRGAFRHVRLENLTQAERNLLYNVRDFARFRRLFYVDISTTYLNLLTQVQAIRNARSNVANLRENLIEYDYYVQLELVSQIQRDQVFQQYQNGRLSLLAAEQNLALSLDQFKFQLGLPAWIPLEIDESLLSQFELYDERVLRLQDSSQQLMIELMEYLPPDQAPQDFMLARFKQYQQMRSEVAELVPLLNEELAVWKERLEETDEDSLSVDDQLDFEQQVVLAERLKTSLGELLSGLENRSESDAEIERLISQAGLAMNSSGLSALQPNPTQQPDQTLQPSNTEPLNTGPTSANEEEKIPPAIEAWQALQQAVGMQLRSEIAELYLAQTQIRLYLIDIDLIPELKSEPVVTFAFDNRLDLMNRQAVVMDAFRRVEVAADALESDLSVTGGVALGSDPSKNNAFRLDSSANQYTVGVQFDGPLNRLNERNFYRASQIAYQQASRDYIAGRDSVANQVREILRQLELARLNFQIARQQVVAATRQVDQAQIDLRSSTQAEANLTLFLLQALQGVLDAKNNLVSNWIAYRIQKMRLFAALELLYLDENGQWINEDEGLALVAAYQRIDGEYFPLAGTLAESRDDTEPIADTATPDAADAGDAQPQGDGEVSDPANLEEVELPPADAPDGPVAPAAPGTQSSRPNAGPGVVRPVSNFRLMPE